MHLKKLFPRFAQFLTYKAERLGKKVIRIGEEKTTKACCKCGKLSKRTIYERFIKCDCGNQIDRDLNSAVNIMVKFLKLKEFREFEFLSYQPSVNEELFLQMWDGFLRHTVKPAIKVGANS